MMKTVRFSSDIFWQTQDEQMNIINKKRRQFSNFEVKKFLEIPYQMSFTYSTVYSYKVKQEIENFRAKHQGMTISQGPY